MRTDLFENAKCKTCGNTSNFQRLENLTTNTGTDFLCRCSECGTFFVRSYERQVQL